VAARTAELKGALQALRQADARRRQLFADISHELRTPTTAIRGEAEITLRGRDREAAEYRAALQRIVETSRQLGAVIDDLLAMARSDIDALALARRPIDLAEPLAEALAQAAPLAAERGAWCSC
jgi:signal transduction histidine kinase